jgi:prepilin-type processing-associated H-X9-DG protein
MDMNAAFDLIAEVLPQADASEEAATTLRRYRQELEDDLKLPQLLSAGITSVYVVLNTDDLPRVLIAVPIDARSNEAQIVDWIENTLGHPGETLRKGNLILSGPESVLTRWKDKPGMRRPDLDRAASAARSGAIQAFIVPDADTRRVVEALLASWPEPRLSVPNGAIVNGVQWGTLTVQWPPQLSLDLRIEAADSSSAAVLNDTLKGMLATVRDLPWANESVPNLDHLLERLRPEVDGRAIRLTLDRQQSTRVIADLLVPPLQRMREKAKQMVCIQHLKQVALEVHLYAQEHNNLLPPNLQTVADAGKAPAEVFLCQGEPYIYRGADLRDISAPPMAILAHDRANAHRGGRNIAFIDGHVEWTSEENFNALIERDNELRRNRGLPEKPAQ